MAPSTLDTFLGSFTFGNVRRLEKVPDTILEKVWSLGGGPGGVRKTACAGKGGERKIARAGKGRLHQAPVRVVEAVSLGVPLPENPDPRRVPGSHGRYGQAAHRLSVHGLTPEHKSLAV